MAPAKAHSVKTPTRIQLRNSTRWVEIDDLVELSVPDAPPYPLKPSSSLARTKIRASTKGRSRIRAKPPSADASFDDDSEDDIVPKQTGPAKKRDAHDDTPQDGAEEAKNDPQDGLGNPNVSGIAPPIPANLVESVLTSLETDFHVVTSGTEVGIFTNKGVADACLQCEFPLSVTFSTWALAMAHYAQCFVDGSVVIKPQIPLNGPARKKRRPNLPASTPKASVKVKKSAFESPYSPLFFPASPTPEQDVSRQKRPLTSCEILVPKYSVNRQKHPLTRSEVRAREALAPSSTDNPLLSPFTSRAQPTRVVYVDDDSDEEGAYAALVRLATATPIATAQPSRVVYVDDDSDEEGAYAAPVRLANATPVARSSTPIIVHDSDSEEYMVSDIELTNDVLELLDAPVHPTTATRHAKVEPGLVEQHSSPIVIYASDSEEYEVSDIDLDENTLRLLDELD